MVIGSRAPLIVLRVGKLPGAAAELSGPRDSTPSAAGARVCAEGNLSGISILGLPDDASIHSSPAGFPSYEPRDGFDVDASAGIELASLDVGDDAI